jgi:hypothetical protein
MDTVPPQSHRENVEGDPHDDQQRHIAEESPGAELLVARHRDASGVPGVSPQFGGEDGRLGAALQSQFGQHS